jgi:hypothetical protein
MKRHHCTGILAALLLFLGTACGSTPDAPDPKTELPYPETKYLKAVGYGQTIPEAEREARAALAAIFQSRIQAETMARAESVMADGMESYFEKQVESTVQVVSKVDLEGVQVVEPARDENTGTYAATAILDRQQAGRQWREALMRADNLLQAELGALPETRGKMMRLAALNRAMGLMLQQEALRSRLRVIGIPAAMPETDMAAVASELAALRQETLFHLQISGEESESAERTIRDRLSRDGFLMSASEADAAGIVTGKVVLQPLELQNPNVRYVRAIVSAQLVDTETGIRFLSATEKVRKGHVDANEATRKAVEAAAAQVADRVARELGRFGVADGFSQ